MLLLLLVIILLLLLLDIEWIILDRLVLNKTWLLKLILHHRLLYYIVLLLLRRLSRMTHHHIRGLCLSTTDNIRRWRHLVHIWLRFSSNLLLELLVLDRCLLLSTSWVSRTLYTVHTCITFLRQVWFLTTITLLWFYYIKIKYKHYLPLKSCRLFLLRS